MPRTSRLVNKGEKTCYAQIKEKSGIEIGQIKKDSPQITQRDAKRRKETQSFLFFAERRGK